MGAKIKCVVCGFCKMQMYLINYAITHDITIKYKNLTFLIFKLFSGICSPSPCGSDSLLVCHHLCDYFDFCCCCGCCVTRYCGWLWLHSHSFFISFPSSRLNSSWNNHRDDGFSLRLFIRSSTGLLFALRLIGDDWGEFLLLFCARTISWSSSCCRCSLFLFRSRLLSIKSMSWSSCGERGWG